jgi:hypothetical protein
MSRRFLERSRQWCLESSFFADLAGRKYAVRDIPTNVHHGTPSGFGPEGLRAENDIKTMICREQSFRTTSQNCDASHNLKVTGSNPVPATKLPLDNKDLESDKNTCV